MNRLVIILVLLFSSLASATDYYVAVDGNDACDGLSWANAKLTPQGAIDAASSGDSLFLGSGTYLTSGTTITLKTNMTVDGNNQTAILTQDNKTIITLTLAAGYHIKNLTINHTGTPTQPGNCVAIKGAAAHNGTIEDCTVNSTGTGIYYYACDSPITCNVDVNSAEIGIFNGFNTSISKLSYTENCTLSCRGWTICQCTTMYLNTGTHYVDNCTITASLPDGTTYRANGIYVLSLPAVIRQARAFITNGSITASCDANNKEACVYSFNADGNIVLDGVGLNSSNLADCYDIYNKSTAEIFVNDCGLNPGKVYGNINVTTRNRSRYESSYFDNRR